MAQKRNRSQESRTAILEKTKEPIGYLALAILIFEGLGIAAFTAGVNPVIVFSVCVAAALLLAATVVFLAYKRPEALRGLRYEERVDPRTVAAPLEAQIEALKKELDVVRTANARTKASLDEYESLKTRIIGYLEVRSASVDQLQKNMFGALDQSQTHKNEVLSALGALITEGKVERRVDSVDDYTIKRH
jgi:hypothetical protein